MQNIISNITRRDTKTERKYIRDLFVFTALGVALSCGLLKCLELFSAEKVENEIKVETGKSQINFYLKWFHVNRRKETYSLLFLAVYL